jgi:hypothetical protein
MLAAIASSSMIGFSVFDFRSVSVLASGFSNRFRNTATDVAMVIYTPSLKPVRAVIAALDQDDVGHSRRWPPWTARCKVSGQRRVEDGIGEQSLEENATAKHQHDPLHSAVEHASTWMRMLNVVCIGLGMMIGYKRMVMTIGERIGKQPLTLAQGALAELFGERFWIFSVDWSASLRDAEQQHVALPHPYSPALDYNSASSRQMLRTLQHVSDIAVVNI